MAAFDLPLRELETYSPEVREPSDFDAFWAETLADARQHDPLIAVEPVPTGLELVDTWDITFAGFTGQPIRAWYTRPAGSQGRQLPAVVGYLGYGRGRGLPHERLVWPCAGYAHLLMDTRGQGSQYGTGGDTPDPVGSPPASPGFLTRGISHPRTAYLRRLVTDAVRAVDAVAALPDVDVDRIAVAGASQGGGLAISAAGLTGQVSAVLATVPFLCHIERSTDITDEQPYAEIVRYLSVHRDAGERVRTTLSYFDNVNHARRATAPALFGCALRDMICPPSGVFAAFNALGSADREMAVYPYNQHEGGDAVHTALELSWLSARFARP